MAEVVALVSEGGDGGSAAAPPSPPPVNPLVYTQQKKEEQQLTLDLVLNLDSTKIASIKRHFGARDGPSHSRREQARGPLLTRLPPPPPAPQASWTRWTSSA